MTLFRTMFRVALAVSALLSAAGCGGGSSNPSAESLISGMKAAVNSAGSVHIAGSLDIQNHFTKIDMSFTKSGDLFGSVSDGSAGYELLVTGGKMYLAPNQAYLAEQGIAASYCPVLCGKYANVGSAPSVLSMQAIFRQAIKNLDPGAMTVTGKHAVDGLSAWVLTDPTETIYIAAHGKPYILRDNATGSTAGTLDFTQWNAVTIPGPPPASQMVDQSKLPG